MSLIGKATLLAGYTLTYAAVVGGQYPAFAKDPWLGIMTDAYTLGSSGNSPTTTTPTTTPARKPKRARTGAGGPTGAPGASNLPPGKTGTTG